MSDGDYFYLPNKAPYWWRADTSETNSAIIGFITFENVYFTGLPIDSVDVTGTANGTSLPLTPDEENRPSMTVKVGQTVTLNGGFTVPGQEEHGLKSDAANISYSWRCKHAGSTTSGSGQSYTLESIQYGTYELTLTVTDSQYHYTKSLTFYLYAMQPAGQRTQIYLKEFKFNREKITKHYDGTTKAPKYLELVFGDENRETISIDSQYYTATIVYDDPNCGADKTITATVTLTAEGAEVYQLGTHDTAKLASPAEITQASTSYQLNQVGEARVGESVFQRLQLKAIWYLVEGASATDQPLFDPVTPGTPITVEGETLSVKFYRLHPGNITNRGKSSTISPGDFIHDPSMNEELTASSTFTAAGTYYVYAIAEPTRNFAGMTTSYLTIQVQETEDSAKHHEGSAAWDGTITATKPIATGETKSVYLSGALPNVSTELLLSREKKLTLCLNGKTLSATNSITSYNHIRVTDNAALTVVDCTGTGVVKGTVPTTVNGGAGGIAYVADGGTITIKGGKLTGGVASTGGAIVVDAGGTLNIEGGEISGNLVQTGNGGAIYVKDGGTVNIYDGIIRDNQVLDGNGGAIYIAKGGTVNLYGGTITGNTASGLGGGIYVEEGGKLNVQGAPVVTGNTAGGKENNVYLPAGQRIAITENGLNSDAEIGVTSESGTYPALIANAAQDASAQFTADDKNAAVIWLNGALSLVQKPAVAAAEDESTVTVSVGTNYLPGSVVIMLAEYAENGQLVRVQTATVAPEQGEYTFQRTAGTWVRCFLLRQDHTPLTPALAPRV
ncbi:MAG: right-handed parallel beta-helix repeat-containing protein [Clostridia bacterium]|nr:right-handed parallel beta-helix repeat-containing protein [Clostridia bacterium]MDY2929845.1 right-handed parallel beta-helix repeat-containing protein [Clostridiaceae bacterium]